MNKFLSFITSSLLTLLGLILLTFTIGTLIPTDPVLSVVGEHASQALYTATRAELGLDQGVSTQLARYIYRLAHGDLGRSLITSQPVWQDLKLALPATFELASFAMLISLVLALPLGVLSAYHQNQWPDHLAQVLSLLSSSVSVFWAGLMGLSLFYVKLSWLPGPGRFDLFFQAPPVTGSLLLDSLWQGDLQAFINALNHLILPGTILAFFKIGHLCRMTRSFVLDQLSQEYVLGAKLKGLSTYQIFKSHVLANAALPLLSVIALSFASLLEGSTFIETIFLWPGLGFYLAQALYQMDMNAILGATLVIGCVFILLNQSATSLQTLLDPRMQR